MDMRKKSALAFLMVALLALAAFFYLIFTVQLKGEERLKVGLILPTEKSETGWYGEAYQGLENATTDVGAELFIEENVPDSVASMAAVDRLHRQGARLIMSATFGYMDLFEEARHKYPDTIFFTIAPYSHQGNIRTFFVRLYNMRYLSGMQAGMKTKTGKIGYISTFPNPDSIHELNAFTLGVRRTNPEARVISAWLGDDDRDSHAREVAAALINDVGVDVIGSHRINDVVAEEALERGVYALGSHSYLPAQEKLLSRQCFNWQVVWAQLLKDYARNFNQSGFYWFDYRTAQLYFDISSPAVTESETLELRQAETDLINGYEPFSGLIRDTEGKVRCEEGEYISDIALREFIDWYVEGVDFYGPKPE